jgi:hypothetical protein
LLDDNEKVRPMTKRELKKLLSMKLRDPSTSTKDFVAMLPKISKLNPGCNRKRKPSRVEKEQDIDALVLQIEGQRRLKLMKKA